MRCGTIAIVLASCAAFAACAPARPLPLPPDDGATLLILAVEASTFDSPLLFAGAPEQVAPILYVPLDGHTRLTALLYDRTAEDLDLSIGNNGWLESFLFDGRPLPEFSHGYHVTVGAQDPDVWAPIDQLPRSLEDVRLPPQNIDRCFATRGCLDGQSCTHACPSDQPDPPLPPDDPEPASITHAVPCLPDEAIIAPFDAAFCLTDPCVHGCGTETACPADGWPMVQDGPGVFFVDSSATGIADGSRAAPFLTIDEAVASGAETIALRDGNHRALGLRVITRLTLIGGCLNTSLALGVEVRPGATLSLNTLSVFIEANSKIDEGATLTSTESAVVVSAPTQANGANVEVFDSSFILTAPFALAGSTFRAVGSNLTAATTEDAILAVSSTISIERSIVGGTQPKLDASMLSIEDSVLSGGVLGELVAPILGASRSRVDLRRTFFDNVSIGAVDADVRGEDVIVLQGASNRWLAAGGSWSISLHRLFLNSYAARDYSIVVFDDATLSVGDARVIGTSFFSSGRTTVDIARAAFDLARRQDIPLGGTNVSIADLRAQADNGLVVEPTGSARLTRVDVTASPMSVSQPSTGLAVLDCHATLEDIRVQGAERGMLLQPQDLTMNRFDVRGVSVGATLVPSTDPMMLVDGYIEGRSQGVMLRGLDPPSIFDLLQLVRVEGPIVREP